MNEHRLQQLGQSSFAVERRSAIQREPAIPVAVALGVGIAIDRLGNWPLPVWYSLCVAAMLVLAVIRARLQHQHVKTTAGILGNTCGAGLLLVAIAAFGGGWHHIRWSLVSTQDLLAYVTPTPQPIELTGSIDREPTILPRKETDLPSAIPRFDRTVFALRVRETVAPQQRLPVMGKVWVEVQGHLLGFHDGDEIRVLGRIAQPAAAANPGGFDFRDFLRREGIHSILRIETPEAVEMLKPQNGWLAGLRRATLNRCRRLIRQGLSERTSALAEALLLGTRTEMPDDLRNAFVQSGTMHMLAISGLHVGILASFLWFVARLCGLGRRSTMLLVAAVLVAYAALTEARPPVVRATILTLLWIAGEANGRASSLANHLAIAAIVVMLWNPTQLFSIGPQLSFLAVLGLIWSGTLESPQSSEASIDDLVDDDCWWRPPLAHTLKIVRQAYKATAAIWLFTLPLTMACFHVVSVVGFFINVLLIPWLTLTLWIGYTQLLVGLLFPAATRPFAWCFDKGLLVLVQIIDWSARLPGAYWNVPAPENWWLIGFYLTLACLTISPPASLIQKVCARGLLAWTLVGLAVAAIPAPPGLRCTFLAVGHGCAILVEFPDGETLLYDAGSLQDPERAVRVVSEALTRHGHTRINALMISHADIDHFNAAYGLIEAMPVEKVLVAPSFLDFHQPSVTGFCDRAAAAHVPIRLVGATDRLRTRGSAQMTILHPQPDAPIDHDNANSLVLKIEYAGRTILLTGDLEGAGLDELLAQPAIPCDVLLAPHHGSRAANPRALDNWATPTFVVVSGGRAKTGEALEEIYGADTTVLATVTSGAVTFTITPQGELHYETMRNSGHEQTDMDNTAY